MSKTSESIGTDASSTIPGTIFPDDIVSPQPPPDPDYIPSSSPINNNGGVTQIEVNSTTQIVLITLGVVVGALFFLGIFATYYISHKNKRASLEKQEGNASREADGDGDSGDLESGVTPGEGSPGGGGEKEEVQEHSPSSMEIGATGRDHYIKTSFSSQSVLLNSEKGFTASSSNGNYSASEDESTGSGVGFGLSRGGTPKPEILAHGYADSTNNHTVHITPTTTASHVAQHSQNPRSSFIEVAQAYAHRQSLVNPIDPSNVIQQRMSIIASDNPGFRSGGIGRDQFYQQQHQLEGSRSVGTILENDSYNNQWEVPSTSMEDSCLLVDPFKTNNNSMASLNQILEQGPPSTLLSQQQLPTTIPVTSAPSPIRPHTMIGTTSIDISYQPPAKSSDPNHGATSRRTSAFYQHHGYMDRRSIVGRPADSAQTRGSGAENIYGDVGGRSTWHRKRASMVIPEGTTSARLWKEDAAAFTATTISNDMPSTSPLSSGPIPRIGVVSEENESLEMEEAGITNENGEKAGYRPSVRNGAAVFEGSIPRKVTSRSPSRSRLDESLQSSQQQLRHDQQDQIIDSLSISEAPAAYGTIQKQRPSVYRRKWATDQIALDDSPDITVSSRGDRSNIKSTILQSGDDSDESEHVVVSLPSPRGCLLENEDNNYPQVMGGAERYLPQQQYEQDAHEFGMRSLPIVLGHYRTSPGGEKGSRSGSTSASGGRRSAELVNSSTGGRFTYLDDYREQKQQQKFQKQQQQQQNNQCNEVSGGDSVIKVARRRSAQFLQNALKRASVSSP
ncbi:hypothetical protein FBU30_010679 [Linnemannia zychae]|nr:hypothetical protein FBU30_010679 [Linnemannia zychae]